MSEAPLTVRFTRLPSNPDLPLPERATPHAAVAKSPRLMVQKATDQVSQATLYVTRLVVVTAAVGAVVFAALQATPVNRRH